MNILTDVLKRCCGCGREDVPVTTLICMDFAAPDGTAGWGCLICGLPPRGAMGCYCDRCVAADRPALFCFGGRFPADQIYVLVTDEQRAKSVEHNQEMHAAYELEFLKAAGGSIQ